MIIFDVIADLVHWETGCEYFYDRFDFSENYFHEESINSRYQTRPMLSIPSHRQHLGAPKRLGIIGASPVPC